MSTENKVVSAAKAGKAQEAPVKVKKKVGVPKGSTRLNSSKEEFNELAEAVKTIRHIKNAEVGDVAAAMDLAHISYFDIEKRAKMPTLKNIKDLAAHFNMSYTAVLTFSENIGKLKAADRLNPDTALSLYAQTFGLEDISDIVQ